MARHSPIPLAVALVLAAALPASAHAATEVAYDVTVEGAGHYIETKHVPPGPAGEGDWTLTTELDIAFRATVPDVEFRDGRLQSDPEGTAEVRATGTAKTVSAGSDGVDTETCSFQSVPAAGARAALGAQLLTPLDGSEALVVRAADAVEVEWSCTGDPLGTDGDGMTIPVALGEGPFDAEFTLPREAIGMGRIIQVVQGAPEHADQRCVSQDDRSTCSGGWTGTVTFDRTRLETVADPPSPATEDDLAPLVPAPITPDDLAPLVAPRRAALDAKASTLSFRAGCAGGCTGTAALSLPAAGRAASAARTRRLATMRFRVPAGAPRTVRLRVPRGARRKLRGARRASLAVALRPLAGGAARRSSLSIRIPRPAGSR